MRRISGSGSAPTASHNPRPDLIKRDGEQSEAEKTHGKEKKIATDMHQGQEPWPVAETKKKVKKLIL